MHATLRRNTCVSGSDDRRLSRLEWPFGPGPENDKTPFLRGFLREYRYRDSNPSSGD
jgi:hypothetical protein